MHLTPCESSLVYCALCMLKQGSSSWRNGFYLPPLSCEQKHSGCINTGFRICPVIEEDDKLLKCRQLRFVKLNRRGRIASKGWG